MEPSKTSWWQVLTQSGYDVKELDAYTLNGVFACLLCDELIEGVPSPRCHLLLLCYKGEPRFEVVLVFRAISLLEAERSIIQDDNVSDRARVRLHH